MNLPGEPTCLSRELSGAAAVKGGMPGTSGSGNELGGSLGLVAGTGRVGKEEPGCRERQRAELTLASFCKLRRGPAQPTHGGANFLPCSRGPNGSET